MITRNFFDGTNLNLAGGLKIGTSDLEGSIGNIMSHDLTAGELCIENCRIASEKLLRRRVPCFGSTQGLRDREDQGKGFRHVTLKNSVEVLDCNIANPRLFESSEFQHLTDFTGTVFLKRHLFKM